MHSWRFWSFSLGGKGILLYCYQQSFLEGLGFFQLHFGSALHPSIYCLLFFSWAWRRHVSDMLPTHDRVPCRGHKNDLDTTLFCQNLLTTTSNFYSTRGTYVQPPLPPPPPSTMGIPNPLLVSLPSLYYLIVALLLASFSDASPNAFASHTPAPPTPDSLRHSSRCHLVSPGASSLHWHMLRPG